MCMLLAHSSKYQTHKCIHHKGTAPSHWWIFCYWEIVTWSREQGADEPFPCWSFWYWYWYQIYVSNGRTFEYQMAVFTRQGGGELCLFLAKFIDFVKVLLNIRWCCEQGAPCLFFANAMLTKCCLNASSDNQADSTIGSCRYKKRHFNKTWNELIVCKYQLANFWVFVQHNCKWGMTENYICKKAVLFLLIDNYHFTLACQKYFTQFSEWCWLQWLAGWW